MGHKITFLGLFLYAKSVSLLSLVWIIILCALVIAHITCDLNIVTFGWDAWDQFLWPLPFHNAGCNRYYFFCNLVFTCSFTPSWRSFNSFLVILLATKRQAQIEHWIWPLCDSIERYVSNLRRWSVLVYKSNLRGKCLIFGHWLYQ